MRVRHLFGAIVAVVLVHLAAPAAQAATEIQWWHAMSDALGQWVNDLADGFNRSQSEFKVVPVFKGTYTEAMTGAIAAFRAHQQPHILQVFEVGTATMMASKGAIKPVYQLMAEAGEKFDPKAYLGPVAGYYTTTDGKMLSMPFNSSTPVLYYNKDAFKKAGLDPNKPPRTWPELREAAKKIRAANAAPCGFTTAWPTWTQFEQFSAIHNVPLATKANGMGGLDTELKINSPLHVRHVQTLIDMQKEGTFKYGGRDAAGDALFPSGECAIIHASSGLRARIEREAKFEWGAAMLPYYPGTPGAPKNSIIGGAAFWVMTAPSRKPEEYKAVAEFFRYISRPEVVAKWHTDTGFLPVTFAGYERVKASGFYQKNPGTDIPFLQMTRTAPTENSRGLRLGNMPEIRNIIQEELEKALQGQQSAQQALDNAVQRGNTVLRNFERANRS
jgi:sn-glycerol 3-phosphate transport system substrate-binding protein